MNIALWIGRVAGPWREALLPSLASRSTAAPLSFRSDPVDGLDPARASHSLMRSLAPVSGIVKWGIAE